MYEFFAQLYVISITFVPITCGGQKRALDSLKRVLQVFMSCYLVLEF